MLDSVKPKGSQQLIVQVSQVYSKYKFELLTGELPESSRTSDYILSESLRYLRTLLCVLCPGNHRAHRARRARVVIGQFLTALDALSLSSQSSQSILLIGPLTGPG